MCVFTHPPRPNGVNTDRSGKFKGGPHMPGNISFNYAIFKRLQGAYVAGIGTATGGHMDPANPMGGFCLLYSGHPNGILGKIANNNAMGLAGVPHTAAAFAISLKVGITTNGLRGCRTRKIK